ncbi:hypothetical protein QZH41_012332, partial [Actinostola sp. cb2023]
NGRWTRWSRWSQCSKTCGKGYKYRTRTCTNPPPANGGRKCVGSGKQTSRCCVKASCKVKVNGGWTKWSKWSPPSKTCGGIVIHGRYRTRTCTNPPPSNGGRYCVGRAKDYMTLFLPRCPVRVDGGWSSWGAWCKCSKSCGAGIKYRKRSCTKPKPANGGKPCQGKDRQIRTCHVTQCMPSYNHKGCFKDSASRTMPNLLGIFSKYNDAVARCGKKSFKLEYKCFGVQNGGECWSGPNAHKTYNKLNKCSKCRHGKGGPYANDVYCFAGVPGISPITSAPTEKPTVKPTKKPTVKPTKKPTVKPNKKPIVKPTKKPTVKPTKKPTVKPTKKPTVKPTKKPTVKPTKKPTAKPDCWSPWVYSECTKPCGCGYKARTRFCKCGDGKFGSCPGLPMETFKCNCHQCGPPVDA